MQNKQSLFPNPKKIKGPIFGPDKTRGGSNPPNGGNNNSPHRKFDINFALKELESLIRKFEMEYNRFYKGSLNNYSLPERLLIQTLALHPENARIKNDFITFGYGSNLHNHIFKLARNIYTKSGKHYGSYVKKRLKGFFDNDF